MIISQLPNGKGGSEVHHSNDKKVVWLVASARVSEGLPFFFLSRVAHLFSHVACSTSGLLTIASPWHQSLFFLEEANADDFWRPDSRSGWWENSFSVKFKTTSQTRAATDALLSATMC
jgi:hypothetical protein